MGSTRHFLSLSDYSREEIFRLVTRSVELKRGISGGKPKPLEGKSVGLIFEKPSTRTRVSFEVAIHQLGGKSIFMARKDVQIGRGEPIRDTARVLSRYLDAVVIRTFGHELLEEFARWSTIPVINGLSDSQHPCQVLGDLLTVHEAGLDITTMRAAWVGDGNNMANTWIGAAELLGFDLTLACPAGYDPTATFSSEKIVLTRDPIAAVRDADVVSTDVWASMGQESEAEARRIVFQGYQVNMDVLKHAKTDVYVLHCLPAHRDEEITDDVMESRHSLIWEQAENRLHVQKAVLEMLIAG